MSTFTFIYFHYAGCYNVFMETKLFTEERQDEIINLLKERKSVTVQNLSDYFGVSGATIRTDLSVLEKKGCLRRTHGGAVLPKSVETYLQELGIHERSHFQEKKAIAEAALKYVSSHETILIDNGTTISAFCTALAGSSLSGLTVYSNDLYGMQILESKENCELHLIGGCIRSGFHYTYGQQVLDELGSYHFKKLFLATSAVSADGLTTVNSDLAAVKRAMINASEEVILLADSSKFGQVGFQKFADLSQVDLLITDSGIRKKDQKALLKKISRVITV